MRLPTGMFDLAEGPAPGPKPICGHASFFAGATSAPCLIFIFPAIFYFRIIPTEREPAKSTPKILVRGSWRLVAWCGAEGAALPTHLTLTPDPSGPLFRCAGPPADDHELEFHHHRLGVGDRPAWRKPLGGDAHPVLSTRPSTPTQSLQPLLPSSQRGGERRG